MGIFDTRSLADTLLPLVEPVEILRIEQASCLAEPRTAQSHFIHPPRIQSRHFVIWTISSSFPVFNPVVRQFVRCLLSVSGFPCGLLRVVYSPSDAIRTNSALKQSSINNFERIRFTRSR